MIRVGVAVFFRGEEDFRFSSRVDYFIFRVIFSLKVRVSKVEVLYRFVIYGFLERCEGLAYGSSKVREVFGRLVRVVFRLGVSFISFTFGFVFVCRGSLVKGVGVFKFLVSGGKGRNLVVSGSRVLGVSVKLLVFVAGRIFGGFVIGFRVVLRVAFGVVVKVSRGIIMGIK